MPDEMRGAARYAREHAKDARRGAMRRTAAPRAALPPSLRFYRRPARAQTSVQAMPVVFFTHKE